MKEKSAPFSLTCLLDPGFQREVEKLRISVLQAKLVENHLDDRLAGGVVVDRQGLVLDVSAENSRVYLDYHLS